MSDKTSHSNADDRVDELTPEEKSELRRKDRDASEYFRERLAQEKPPRERPSSSDTDKADEER